MRALALNPGDGKTTSLVQYMMREGNENVIYVAPTLAQAHNAERFFFNLGGSEAAAKGRFLSVASVDRAVIGRSARLVFDEAEGVIEALAGARVELIAFTPDDKKAIWVAARDKVGAARRALAVAEEEFATLRKEGGR